MEPKESLLLDSLRTDLDIYGETVRDISLRIIAEGISQYPVFIAHPGVVDL